MEADENPNLPDAEFLGQTGAKVEGQTRLDAAYGSGDGDEQSIPSASVAGGTKQHEQAYLGTVFDQSYQSWGGSLNPRWARNWAILRHHVYGLFSKGHRPYGANPTGPGSSRETPSRRRRT